MARITVTQPPFTITPQVSSVNIAPGGTATFNLNVSQTGAAQQTVALTASNLQPAMSATFTPAAVVTNGASALAIATQTSIAPGAYSVNIVGTAGGATVVVPVTVVVAQPTPWTYYFHDDAPNPASLAVIYNAPPPDGSHDYEVRANVHLTGSGGAYILYARATPDANLYGNTGTFYAFALTNPQVANGVCTAPANYILYKRSGGSLSVLASFTDGCHDGMTLRMVVRAQAGGSPGYIGVWANQPYGMNFWDPDAPNIITTGLPGVGAFSIAGGSALQLARVYPADRIAPNAINPQTAGLAAWSNRVDVQFQGVADDPSGVGLEGYQIYREGVLFANSPTPTFSDHTVAANTTYHYQVIPYDQHYNLANGVTLTVAVPPANSVEPRMVGVKSLGSYWGAAGEQINMLSGNLNFSLPLVSPKSRGWGVSLKLNYDSQMWRMDAGGTWNSGRDVGYGLGWRLLAGSITPYYTGTWSIDHYTFTDSTGAEYRLDQNNTANGQNLWTSQEGTRAIFDANANALRFPDGSFWNMAVQSSGAEQDAGTLYPSQMQDTNGNQLS